MKHIHREIHRRIRKQMHGHPHGEFSGIDGAEGGFPSPSHGFPSPSHGFPSPSHGFPGSSSGGRSRGGPRRGPGPAGQGRGGGRRGGGRRRPRVSRGDVRVGVLAILSEQPMHGYQIMQELEERSSGAWQPSPGSIYPTLQLLADEGLIVSRAVDGKNVFSLTEEGAAAVLANDDPPPWERFNGEGAAAYANLRRSMFQLGAAARQVAAAGSRTQAETANQIINEARKAIYRVLGDDDQVPEHQVDNDSDD